MYWIKDQREKLATLAPMALLLGRELPVTEQELEVENASRTAKKQGLEW